MTDIPDLFLKGCSLCGKTPKKSVIERKDGGYEIFYSCTPECNSEQEQAKKRRLYLLANKIATAEWNAKQ